MKTKRACQPTYLSAAFAALGTLLFLVNVSCADIKIVSEVTVTGGPSQDQRGMFRSPRQAGAPNGAPGQPPAKPGTPKTVTTYYKGRMARTEGEGEPVTIYDGEAGKVYTLHPDQETYSVLSVEKMLEELSAPMRPPPNGRMPRSVHFDTKVKLEKSDATKTVAGKDARRYLVTASMEMSLNGGGGFPGEGGFPGGGGPGGGGFHGGGPPGGGGFPGGPGMSPPSVRMQGEYWLVDAALLPAGDRSPLLPLLQQTISVGPVLTELNGKMVKMKLAPLASKTTVTMTVPNAESQEPLVTTMEVKTITEEALDDALFKVPSNYREVKPSRDGAN